MEPRWNTSIDGELMASLVTFVQLYDQHKESFQQASEHFIQAAAQVDEKREDFDNGMVQALFTMFGGALGTVIGGVTGGIWGTMGAVGAVAYTRFFCNIKVAGAAMGIVGSMFGGIVGGAFSGLIGGSVEVANLAAGRKVHSVTSNVLWFTVGFVTGSAIGNTFSKSFGAAGGAVGGGFGALQAAIAAVNIAEKVIDLKGKQKQMEKTDMMLKSGKDFSESIKPLVDKLITVQRICDKMASNETVKGVADQTVKTLTAVTEMEKSVSNSQREAGWSEFLSSVVEAASHCKKIQEELQRMREEVDKLL